MSYLLDRRVRYDSSDTSIKLNTDQLLMDQMDSSFVAGASDWKAMTSMALGGFAYKLSKLTALKFLPGIGMGAKGIALGVEVATFRSSEAVLRGQSLGEAFEGRAFLSTSLDFFLLKGAGKALEGRSFILTHAGQSFTMAAGHQLGASLHLVEREQGSFVQRWMKAEVSNVQMMAGMELMGTLTGNRLSLLEKTLEIQSQAMEWSHFPSFDLTNKQASIAVMASDTSAMIPLPGFERAEIREWFPRVQRESFRWGFNADGYFDGIVRQPGEVRRKLLLFVPFMAESGRNYYLRKKAYEKAFRLVEEEILPLEKTQQLKALNQILMMIDETFAETKDGGRAVRSNFIRFLENISENRIKRISGFRFIEDIELSQDTMYRKVTRGLSLAELQMIVEFGEFVNRDAYSTFAESQYAPAYQKGDASEGLRRSGGEIVLKLRVPAWQMKMGEPYGDMALVHFNDVSEQIPPEMVTHAREMAEQASRYVAENKTIAQLRAEFTVSFREQHGREPERKDRGAFFCQLDYMRMMDALERSDKLSRLVENWFDESEGSRPIGKLPAKYVLWEESLALNRRRYERAPERFQQDVLPWFERVLTASSVDQSLDPRPLTNDGRGPPI